MKEERLNDTLTVFTVGSYDKYEDAEKEKESLIKKGIYEAFGVKSTFVNQIAIDLDQVQKGSYAFNVIYKVEFDEYRVAIPFESIQDLINQQEMEMRESEGGLKTYSLGTFSRYGKAVELQVQLIQRKVDEPRITAYLNGEAIPVEQAIKLTGNE